MVERDRDNDELTYMLRSIAKNAPWVHKIFVLQNPGCKDVWKAKRVAEPEKTVWVNRCALLPPESCPTRNSCIVQSILHKIPDLSEHFIYTDDDNLLIKPATISTFFRNSNGAWLPKVPKYEDPNKKYPKKVYDNISAVHLLEEQVPMHVLFGHCWQPLLKSVIADFEHSYKEFVNFVRSHRTGRYSSKLNQYGTTKSDHANSIEEDFQGIWWWWLHERRMGSEVKSDDDVENLMFGDSRITYWSNWHWLFNQPARIMLNINDDLATEDSVYQHQHQDAINKLEQAFPSVQGSSKSAAFFVKNLDEVVAPSTKRSILDNAFPAPSTENLVYNFWEGNTNLRY
eukprot:TRINITY_DN28095_c0_g4_i1.p1 TRINITY_DN28095_c0_g4~~TRINITY_DN28095_c0_g4_i1.p1  ORF type:complete len:374 (-),score=41.81 TRINITY_DN28095_c0_g4_i1:185-1210(-)